VNATLRSAARTDVGKMRDRNEDSFFAGANVFAVADGLGGHNAGDVASKLAIEPIKELDRTLDGMSHDRVGEALADSVLEANRSVYKRAQSDAKVRGMGTTLTAVAITDGAALIAHVGDSRCYLMRGAALNQLSSDHTLVARMVQEGKLTPEQAEVHPQRSILTRALGAEPEVDVDSLEVDLVAGDRILLCSDGLSSVIPEDRIREILASTDDLDRASSMLIEDANAHGGPDNITVVLIEISGVPAEREGGAPVARVHLPKRAPRARRRRVPARAIVWSLIVVLLLLGGWIGVHAWVNRSYYVGLQGGRVTIFRGLPTEIAGFQLHHVQERTSIPESDVQTFFLDNLRDGIRASSLAEARRVVASMPRTQATPSPTPSPTPTRT